MRIQHNIMAMNAYRNYGNNTSALSKNLEKLSSGYRINRAGDDAAGLAISEKMRAQIQGLNAAQKNVKDAISFVKTAEGAMQEIQDMLSRMKYLATQSANGTYEEDIDRGAIQDEVNSLLEEIDRIADSANFNDIFMLKGGGGAGPKPGEVSIDPVDGTPGTAGNKIDPASFTVDLSGAGNVQGGQKYKLTIGTASVESGTVADTNASDLADAFNGKKITINEIEYTISVEGGTTLKFTETNPKSADGSPVEAPGTNTSVTINNSVTGSFQTDNETDGKFTLGGGTATPTAAKTTLDFDGVKGEDLIGKTFKVGDTEYKFVDDDTKTGAAGEIVIAADDEGAAIAGAVQAALDGKIDDFTVTNTGTKVEITEDDPKGNTKAPAVTGLGSGGGGDGDKYSIVMQIGDTSEKWNQMTLEILSMKTTSLKIDTLKDTGMKNGNASGAIQTIKDAINTVSKTRGQLGAYQNRLEHTANNLSVMTENITDAESTIRDTDVAEEMMAYTKNNILIQSAQAMLAQANAVPQGVLQLLG